MTASDKGHLDVVKTLIEAGANVNHTNKVAKYMHRCGICTCTLYTCITSSYTYKYFIIMLIFRTVLIHVHVYHRKARLHEINLICTCKGDHAIGKMLFVTEINMEKRLWVCYLKYVHAHVHQITVHTVVP